MTLSIAGSVVSNVNFIASGFGVGEGDAWATPRSYGAHQPPTDRCWLGRRPESSPSPRHEACSYRRGDARVKGVVVATDEVEVGPAAELVPGVVRGAGPYAVGNANGELFAVTRHCRHLGADLANGSIDRRGCLRVPHGARYDVATGRMIRGPQGLFAKIPGVDAGYRLLTTVLPLGRGDVSSAEEPCSCEISTDSSTCGDADLGGLRRRARRRSGASSRPLMSALRRQNWELTSVRSHRIPDSRLDTRRCGAVTLSDRSIEQRAVN